MTKRPRRIIDETHTQVCGPGGPTGRWGLQPDLLTPGKTAAGGLPFGAYGMTNALAAVFERPDPNGSARRDLADLQRVYFANRGVREAISSAGPCVGIAHAEADVDQHLNVLSGVVHELTASRVSLYCGRPPEG